MSVASPTNQSRTRKAHLVVVLLVLGAAFALRLHRLEDANIWWDEGLAVWAARQPLAQIARWTASDVHPPLYFWLLHGWRLLVGDHEFAVRFLSAASGTLTVATLWVLGRRLFPSRPSVATLGALFLAFSRFAVWWSQEARMYMLGGLLVTLSLACAVGWRADRPWRVVGYVLAAAAGLWTLYLLVLVPAIVTLYWLGEKRERGGLSWRVRLGAQGAVLLLFLPWALYTFPRLRSWSVESDFSTGAFVNLYAVLLTLGRSTQIEPYLPLAWGLLLGAVGLAVAADWAGRKEWREGSAARLLLLLMLVGPPLAVWAVTAVPRSLGYVPKPEARYLLPFAPPFALLLALAGHRLWEWSRGHRWFGTRGALLVPAIWVGLVLIVQLWSLRDYYAGRYLADDYRSLAATLRAHWQPGDVVVLHTDQPWPVFAYYWPAPFVGTPHLEEATAGGVDYLLRPLWDENQAVWLVVNEDALRADPQRLYETWLTQRAVAQHEWRYGTKRLLLFARTPERAADLLATGPGLRASSPPHLLEAGGVRLIGWEQGLFRARAGEVLHVALTLGGARPARSLPVAVSLVALSSQQVIATARQTATLEYMPQRFTFSVLLPADAPPGEYAWVVRLKEQEARVGRVRVLRPLAPPPAAAPTEPPQHFVNATFGEPPSVRLLGYSLQKRPDALHVQLHWQVLRPLPLSYKVFVHLTTLEGRVVTQRDDYPQQGRHPTTSWQVGEVVPDTYAVPLPDGLAGRYVLKVGLYDPATGQRLGPVRDATGTVQPNDQLVLQELTLPLGQ